MIHLGLLWHVASAKVRQPKALLLPQKVLDSLQIQFVISPTCSVPRPS